MLSSYLMCKGHIIEQAKDDADTTIVNVNIPRAQNQTALVVGRDIDSNQEMEAKKKLFIQFKIYRRLMAYKYQFYFYTLQVDVTQIHVSITLKNFNNLNFLTNIQNFEK